MNHIRELVQKNTNRFKENGYNLDLTYITPRVLAMSFPGSGFQKLRRNPI